jgi:hypothetical protein
MGDARHEKLMADCAAVLGDARELRADIHEMLPKYLREHGTEALHDPAWDDFIDAHPELNDNA